MAAPKHTAQADPIVGWSLTHTENRVSRTLCWECGSEYWDRQDWSLTLSPITEAAARTLAYGESCEACSWHIIPAVNELHPDAHEAAAAIMEAWETE